MPTVARWSGSPMPESISSCGLPTKPAERMTSLPARMNRRTPPPLGSAPVLSSSTTSTPVARPFSITILVAWTRVWTSSVGGARWWT